MSNHIKQYVKARVSCNLNKPNLSGYKAPLKTIITATQPMMVGSCDTVGPLVKSHDGHRYGFTFVDTFSKWCEFVPLPDIKSATVARAFVDHVIARHGCPPYLETDNGTTFTANVFKGVCKILNMKLLYTEAYRPNQNLVERVHSVLRAKLAYYVNSNGDDWTNHLQTVAMAIRSTAHASTKETPYFLMTRSRVCRTV